MNRRSNRLWLVPLFLGLILGVVIGYSARPAPGAVASGVGAASKCKTGSGPAPGSKHYTPGPKNGAVTPLPRVTPVRPQAHLILGMIARPLSAVQSIQKAVDSHNKAYMFYLVPSQVVRRTVTKYGFKPSGVTLVSPPKPFPRYAGRPVRKAVVKYQGKLYQVRVAQPGRQGKNGIWVIVTILPQSVRLGGIGQTATVVAREQHLADTKKKYAFLRDPNQVALKNGPQYGLVPPLKLVTRATPFQAHTGRPTMHTVVSASSVLYDVYVAQFGKHGSKGVWSIAFIDVHQS